MTRALLQQALDVLVKLSEQSDCDIDPFTFGRYGGNVAIAALQAALAQPEPEPQCVAIIDVKGKDWSIDYLSLPVGRHRLYAQQYTYTHPAPAKPLTDAEIDAIMTPLTVNTPYSW